ncbi:unnamed protein product, partial [Darwinula stevensoni]
MPTTPLSSAGHVFAHYDHRIISTVLDCGLDNPKVDMVFDKVYENFVGEIDACGNSPRIYDCKNKRFQIRTNLTNRIGNLNPHWNEPDKNTDDGFSNAFIAAMQTAGNEFKSCITYFGTVWLPAREMLLKAFQTGNSLKKNRPEIQPGCSTMAQPPESSCKIATHNGKFHCDEALACFMLQVLPEYKDAKIIRTRDEELLSKCDVVVDVGKRYIPEECRFDHHQNDFKHSLSTLEHLTPKKMPTTPLSSAGLVFAHFGHRIISTVLDCGLEDLKVDVVFDKVYENFVEEIDACDNGYSICDCKKKKFQIRTNLTNRIGNMNPQWNEKDKNTDDGFYTAFLAAMETAGNEFKSCITYFGTVWLPAREKLLEAFKTGFQDESREILALQDGFPWMKHLFELEEEGEKYTLKKGQVKFVIFPDLKGYWKIQAVPISADDRKLRVPLHPGWRVLTNEVEKVDGTVFVHRSGFFGVNKTQDGAINMAKISLAAFQQARNNEGMTRSATTARFGGEMSSRGASATSTWPRSK